VPAFGPGVIGDRLLTPPGPGSRASPSPPPAAPTPPSQCSHQRSPSYQRSAEEGVNRDGFAGAGGARRIVRRLAVWNKNALIFWLAVWNNNGAFIFALAEACQRSVFSIGTIEKSARLKTTELKIDWKSTIENLLYNLHGTSKPPWR
jgi:hypothetical protein